MTQQTIYKIPAPNAIGQIEVYGDPDDACYEWRIIDTGGKTIKDTRTGGALGMQYGQAEIALRDALIYASE